MEEKYTACIFRRRLTRRKGCAKKYLPVYILFLQFLHVEKATIISSIYYPGKADRKKSANIYKFIHCIICSAVCIENGKSDNSADISDGKNLLHRYRHVT